MGPLKETGGQHECLSDRLWFGFQTGDMNEGTQEQHPGCDSGNMLCDHTLPSQLHAGMFLHIKLYIFIQLYSR